jgi:thiamine pyrophosphate-dependent acetolactate synthase large subunit-like protein
MAISNKINRRPFVAALLARRNGALVIPGLGSPTWDCSAAGDSPEYLYSWGGMGLAVPTALGVALARPERRVLALTGDGEMLMGIGALATIAAAAPPNLAIAVLDNARYGETGSQRSHTGLTTDLAAVAAACGWPATAVARDMDEVAALTPRLRREALFAVFRISANEEGRHLPPRNGAYLADRFRRTIGVVHD